MENTVASSLKDVIQLVVAVLISLGKSRDVFKLMLLVVHKTNGDSKTHFVTGVWNMLEWYSF